MWLTLRLLSFMPFALQAINSPVAVHNKLLRVEERHRGNPTAKDILELRDSLIEGALSKALQVLDRPLQGNSPFSLRLALQLRNAGMVGLLVGSISLAHRGDLLWSLKAWPYLHTRCTNPACPDRLCKGNRYIPPQGREPASICIAHQKNNKAGYNMPLNVSGVRLLVLCLATSCLYCLCSCCCCYCYY